MQYHDQLFMSSLDCYLSVQHPDCNIKMAHGKHVVRHSCTYIILRVYLSDDCGIIDLGFTCVNAEVIGHVTLVAIIDITILVAFPLVKSLSWKLGSLRFYLQVPEN